MSNEHEHRSPTPASAWSRGTALAIVGVVALLMAVAAFGWTHYRGTQDGDPRVEILPSTPTSAGGAETGVR